MLAKTLRCSIRQQSRLGFVNTRSFAYDDTEINRMNAQLQRKINILKMFTKEAEFNYEQPQMNYDKETGDVQIFKASEAKKKRRIIRNHDDLE